MIATTTMMGMMSMLAATDAGLQFWGQAGVALAMGLAAVGSGLGIGAAGVAAAGAWAKEGRAGKGLRFTYIICLGAPISQTLYGMIVMNNLKAACADPTILAANAGMLFAVGLATGLGELFSAWGQGLIAAAGIRGMSESDGKGFAFILIALGIIETVGIFVMVFMLGMIPKAAAAAAAAQ